MKFSKWLRRLLLFVGVFGLLLLMLRWHFSLPTDKSLTTYFYSHKTDFFALVDMLNHDQNITRVDPRSPTLDFTYNSDPATPVSSQRFEEYRRLFKNINEVFLRWDTGELLFGMGGWGGSFGGPRWGYIWLPQPPEKELILKSIDDFKPGADKSWHYRPLEGNWYCFITF